MSWSVRLQDGNGKPVIPYDAGIEFDLVENSQRGVILKYLDRCGDTIFNRIQMADFIREWRQLKPRSDNERNEWEKVLRFAETCHRDPHHYLRFIGD